MATRKTSKTSKAVSTVTKTRPVASFAKRANAAHIKANESASLALDFAFDAGEALTEAKAETKTGEWAGWIKANLEFSQRTASIYMKLFANKALIQEHAFNSAEAMSMRAALNAIPKGARKTKVKAHTRGNDEVTMTPSMQITVAVSNYLADKGCTDQKHIENMTKVVFKLLDAPAGVARPDVTVDSNVVDAEFTEVKPAKAKRVARKA